MSKKINILEAELSAAETDAEKISVLNELSWELRLSNPVRGLGLCTEALRLAQATDHALGIAQSLCNCAVCNWYLANYDATAVKAHEALTRFRTLGDKPGEASALNWLGNAYFSVGDSGGALDFHRQSLALRESLGDHNAMAYSLSNIGLVHYRLGDFTSALDHCLRSLRIRDAGGDKQGLAMSLNDIGRIYASMREFASAAECYQKSFELARAIGDRFVEAVTLHYLGELQLSQDESDQAIQSFTDSLNLSRRLGAKEWMYKAHQCLSQIYEQRGEIAEAFEHYKAFHKSEQKALKENAARRARSLTMQFEIDQAQKESELRRAEAENYRLRTVELAKALEDVNRLNLSLGEANAIKTELLAIAAHDLKNPLQSIMGFTELIEEQIDEQPQNIAQHAATIRSASVRMLTLINGLLETASIDGGKFELKKKLVDLSALALQVIEQNMPQAALKSQQMIASLQPETFADIDPDRMKEAIDNLISNAIKYSPHGKRIWISVEKRSEEQKEQRLRDEGRRMRKEGEKEKEVLDSSLTPRALSFIHISVRDEGPGLTEMDKQKIFGKFQRLSARPTGGESSTGLGLAIVKRFTELHGGHVRAESQGEGCGTTFTVDLPAANLETVHLGTARKAV
ncbi:MAG: tetratricopeptide repeat-containing sensor histidine kinase [Rhizobacter sp.]|nr:tetratricopeptide repeat-containing sensor histidine kinase [Chlorobiales bacterium]